MTDSAVGRWVKVTGRWVTDSAVGEGSRALGEDRWVTDSALGDGRQVVMVRFVCSAGPSLVFSILVPCGTSRDFTAMALITGRKARIQGRKERTTSLSLFVIYA